MNDVVDVLLNVKYVFEYRQQKKPVFTELMKVVCEHRVLLLVFWSG